MHSYYEVRVLLLDVDSPYHLDRQRKALMQWQGASVEDAGCDKVNSTP